jgi:hypothetical protein
VPDSGAERLGTAFHAVRQSLLVRRRRDEGKPIIMTEYGADAVAGLHQVVPMPWSEEYQVERWR